MPSLSNVISHKLEILQVLQNFVDKNKLNQTSTLFFTDLQIKSENYKNNGGEKYPHR